MQQYRESRIKNHTFKISQIRSELPCFSLSVQMIQILVTRPIARKKVSERESYLYKVSLIDLTMDSLGEVRGVDVYLAWPLGRVWAEQGL